MVHILRTIYFYRWAYDFHAVSEILDTSERTQKTNVVRCATMPPPPPSLSLFVSRLFLALQWKPNSHNIKSLKDEDKERQDVFTIEIRLLPNGLLIQKQCLARKSDKKFWTFVAAKWRKGAKLEFLYSEPYFIYFTFQNLKPYHGYHHPAVCLTTGPHPLPKRVLHRVRCSGSKNQH
jgi:hypothetical protein